MSLKRNIFANFAGHGWSILIGFLVVPFYIKLLGIEGYGLVGFYLTLQSIFNSFLDFGLSTTINREVARFSVSTEKANRMRDLVRTFEIGYWVIGILLGIGVCLSASFIAHSWIQAESLSPEYIRRVVILMGVSTIFQWPLTLYQGSLIGLQRMVLLNGINIAFSIFRNVGAVLTLWIVSPTLITFFQWQILVVVLQVFTMAFFLWRNLPESDHSPIFDTQVIKTVWRFAVGTSATSFVTFFLSQADRIILSKVLPLEFFGYYTVAGTLNNGLRGVSSQIFSALFPRFSTLVAQNDEKSLRSLYHKSAQLTSVVILPAAFTGAFFSFELIKIWTQDVNVAHMAAPIAAVLFAGTALNSMMGVPSDLVLAYGWTSFGFITNLIATIVIVPLMIALSISYGGIGAAISWVILNLGYVIISPRIIHRRLIKGEMRKWYIQDVTIPFMTALVITGIARLLIPSGMNDWLQTLLILLTAAITLGGTALVVSEIRSWLSQYLHQIAKNYAN